MRLNLIRITVPITYSKVSGVKDGCTFVNISKNKYINAEIGLIGKYIGVVAVYPFLSGYFVFDSFEMFPVDLKE